MHGSVLFILRKSNDHGHSAAPSFGFAPGLRRRLCGRLRCGLDAPSTAGEFASGALAAEGLAAARSPAGASARFCAALSARGLCPASSARGFWPGFAALAGRSPAASTDFGAFGSRGGRALRRERSRRGFCSPLRGSPLRCSAGFCPTGFAAGSVCAPSTASLYFAPDLRRRRRERVSGSSLAGLLTTAGSSVSALLRITTGSR